MKKILLICFFNSLNLLAQVTQTLNELGSDFYVTQGVSQDPSAKLILINEPLMKELGLTIDDLYTQFAIKIDHQSSRRLKATYYGREALEGDGRVLWVDERIEKRINGEFHYKDITVKGMGPTKLAGGQDGLLSMKEAFNSFSISYKNYLAGFKDSPLDLAVFQIDTLKNGEKAAISIRVGSQLRLNHLSYHYKKPRNFQKIFDVMVKRALFLPPNAQITQKLRDQYIQKFIKNLAEDAAFSSSRYFEHGMLHSSNVTSSGRYIDFGTSKYKHRKSPEIYSPKGLIFYFGLSSTAINPSHDLENQLLQLGINQRNEKQKIHITQSALSLSRENSNKIYKENHSLLIKNYKLKELNQIYEASFYRTLLKDLYFKMGFKLFKIKPEMLKNLELAKLYDDLIQLYSINQVHNAIDLFISEKLDHNNKQPVSIFNLTKDFFSYEKALSFQRIFNEGFSTLSQTDFQELNKTSKLQKILKMQGEHWDYLFGNEKAHNLFFSDELQVSSSDNKTNRLALKNSTEILNSLRENSVSPIYPETNCFIFLNDQ